MSDQKQITDEEIAGFLAELNKASKSDVVQFVTNVLAQASARIAALEAENERLRKALEEAEETLGLVQSKALPDPRHHYQVKELGKRIGFGALMSTAEAGWREALEEVGVPTGGEFVSGPCRATVDNCLSIIRAALEAKP